MEKNFNKKDGLLPDKNLLDPIESAKEEGRIYGLGLSGSYSKVPVIRVGFVLIGLSIFLAGALGMIGQIWNITQYGVINGFIEYMMFMFEVGFIAVGGLLIKKALSKK